MIKKNVLIRHVLISFGVLLVSTLLFVGCIGNNVQPRSAPANSPVLGGSQAQEYDLVFAVAGDSRAEEPDWIKPKKGAKYSKYINWSDFSPLMDILISGKDKSGFFMHLGDFGMRGGEPIFKDFKEKMSKMNKANIPVYLAIGNHEIRYYKPETTGEAESDNNAFKAQSQYQNAFSESWMMPGDAVFPKDYKGLAYYFIQNNSLFIVMDSYYVHTKDNGHHQYKKGYYSDFQLKWLQDALIKYKDMMNIFVFSHQPAFYAANGDGGFYNRYNSAKSERSNWILWALLDTYKVDAFFCGHSHFYHRWNVDSRTAFSHAYNPKKWGGLGSDFDSSNLKRYLKDNHPWENVIPQVVNGTCGAPLEKFSGYSLRAEKSTSAYNYSVVKVKDDTITVDVYTYSVKNSRAQPTLFDRFQKQNGQWKNLPLDG